MKHTLLIVEDEPTIQLILEFVLQDDYHVVLKNDGLEAMEWLEAGNTVDMVIADVNMPYLSGYEMLEAIRSSSFFRDLPILMLSGLESSEDRIKCFNLGADDFVVKPFNPDEVKARIKSILRRSGKSVMA
ncbi:response regulator transcription factor [Pontibacter oryzae]|uniref:DNA-binding response regulator n=1 Tax=Pontibacter oryzae TaxID=2304593 RepID=A0A399SKQ6_9BACT|nr:response regulator transcription factor [Pontibacter oryzae]RIJ42527.1 DNA-binding response regulator [Pontibacter oryzae]